MSYNVSEEFIRIAFANRIKTSELPLPSRASSMQRVRELVKQQVTLQLDSIPVSGGKLEATLELVELERQDSPIALIGFGGSHIITIDLPADRYTQRYQAIHRALHNGDYNLGLNPQGELTISFPNIR
jgi:hypothetical protein